MFGLLCRNRWKGVVLLFSVPLIALGCGNFDRLGTEGFDDSGSRLIVEHIEPDYFGESTNQVDVIPDDCDGEDEPFSDHYAQVFMTNRPLNNATEQTASTVHLYYYDLNYTPVTVGTPDLPSLLARPITDSVAIDPCDLGSTTCPEVEFTVELVPVSQKSVLAASISGQVQYNVTYFFWGENDFGESVSVHGSTWFYAANYDNCSGGEGGG